MSRTPWFDRTARAILAAAALVAVVVSLPAAAGATEPVPTVNVTGPWHLTFADEFTSVGVNANNWSTCYPSDCTNRGNPNEAEWYVRDGVGEARGSLMLSAVARDRATPYGVYHYTSGMVQSLGRYSFTYGFAEMRAWLPAFPGMWPAFWLLPASGAWPPEIDVMEAWGPSAIAMTYHWGSNNLANSTGLGGSFAAGWHTYAVDWEPSGLNWYIDGVLAKSLSANQVPIPASPMYLLANLAVDSAAVPSALAYPSTMLIDYIRVWQH